MILNSSQQFLQQIPVLTSASLLAMMTEANRSPPFDPLAEIRNGLNALFFVLIKLFVFPARLRVASMWRRFLAETIDFILLHIFKILIIFFLSRYFDIIDESRLTLTYIISNLLYDETFAFPIELICVEFGYVIASITFEV